MYTPPHNRQDNPDEVFAFMREFSFGTLVTCGAAGLTATHIPLTVTRDGASFRVSGHIAKANAQCADLAAGTEAMAIFASPHAYVSPELYQAGTWVPTWNYVAVHAYGAPKVLDDREAKLRVLAETIAANEAAFQERFNAYPPEFLDAKLKGIVAFEFEVTRLGARWKLSQDRTPAERERISLVMRLSEDPSAGQLAPYMENALEVVR